MKRTSPTLVTVTVSVLILTVSVLFLFAAASVTTEHEPGVHSEPGVCIPESGNSVAPPEILEAVRLNMEALVARESVPSIAVGAAMNGEIIWKEAFGCADLDAMKPADVSTPYSVASVTKPVTAMAVMMLAEQGLIGLDEPISNYLNGSELRAFRGSSDNATVRRVLNHTSGLPLHYNFFYEDDPNSRPDFTESVHRYGILTFEPGERYNYSNFGYGLLDYLIEKVSGKSYGAFLNDHIFEPLGMINSSLGLISGDESPRALRYNEMFEAIPDYDFDHRGGSALYSSVGDLLRFGMYSIGNLDGSGQNLISDASKREMLEMSVRETQGSKTGYGLGWSVREHQSGLKEAYHTGGMAGVRTILLTVPEKDLVVTVLVNSENSISILLAQVIAHMLLPDSYDNPLIAERDNRQSDADELSGIWSGKLMSYNGEQEIILILDQDLGSRVRLGSRPSSALMQAGIDQNGYFTGIFRGEIGIGDASLHPYILLLNLRPNGDELYGSVTAITTGSDRVRFALSGYAELNRVGE
jgi:CubicO group peptidase (beta-lactamase class C family)